MASRSVAANFNGLSCPLEISFGFVHGPSPAVAHIKLAGKILPPAGQAGMFYVGQSTFNGYVTNREYDPIEDETTIRMVDWRDRLHDISFRGAWNMQESDGRFYHIFPNDWLIQRKTYVTRELGQFDFTNFQNLPPGSAFTTTVGKQTIYSAYTLLMAISDAYQIKMTADSQAQSLLRQSYPLNIDFNSGNTTAANVIDSITQKCGMQFTCFGFNNMHFTIRGIPNSTFSASLTQGLLNLCAWNVSSGKIGDELNEQGRRVVVVGDRNKYEYAFCCRQNWNPAWTWGMVFGGIELGKLLESLDLNEYSKLKDMPLAYQDDETYAEADAAGEGALPERKTRNLMTIREYLDKIAFKAYVVDAQRVARFESVVEDGVVGQYIDLNSDTLYMDAGTIENLRDFPKSSLWDNALSNFHYPLSKSLVSDSNLQFLCYATTRNIVRGRDYPFGVQHSLVPRSQGMSLDVEELYRPDNGRTEYRIRVYFNQPQFWLPPGKPFDDPRSVETDMVVMRLCLEGDLFTYTQGEQGQNIRVREKTVTVRSLYQAYIDNKEQSVLTENYLRDLAKEGQQVGQSPVRARDIAQRIATQLLYHEAITTSGNYTFDDRAGFVPDGIIDSVSVNYTAMDGASENINFTSGLNNDRDIISPIPVKQSKPFRNEEEIARDRLQDIMKSALKDKAMAGKAMAVMDAGLHEPGALVGVPLASLAYAKDGVTRVRFGPDIAATMGAWMGGTMLLLDRPSE